MVSREAKKLVGIVRGGVYGHRHHNRNLYFDTKVGLMGTIELEMLDWLNRHTAKPYSIDHKVKPYNISFSDPNDALLFKLTWAGKYACPPHPGPESFNV